MKTDSHGKKYFKLGLHIHTTVSDGAKSPEDAAKEYLADGYDAIAFTDHWIYGEGGELSGLPIISGCEYNVGKGETVSGEMHILALFTERDPAPPRNATRSEIVDAIRKAGGIAVLAHPNWSLNTPDDLEALPGIEATEIYNAVSDAHWSMRPYSDYFIDLCANRGMYPAIFATDDAHYYDGSDSRHGWIMVEAESTSREDLIRAIRERRFYASEGPDVLAERRGNKIIADTSPASVIGILSNRTITPHRTARGDNLTHFEYEIQPGERWIRVEVRDKNGKRAWSNTIVI